MPFFRVDDGLNNHPKARQAGLEAMGLWSLSGAYCMAYLSDGFVPEWYVKTWAKGAALAKRLVAARMWYPAERDGEPGWEFHEWRQDSKAKVQADRKKAAQRKAKSRDSQRESQRDVPSDSARTPGYVPNTPKETSGCIPEAANESNARGPIVPPDAWKLVKRHVSDQHPQANRTDLAIQAKELLTAGTDPDLVEAAIVLWANSPNKLSPKGLRLLVSDIIRQREHPVSPAQRASPAARKVKAGLQLAQQLGDKPELTA